MKKFLLCLLAIGIIAGVFAIGKNWNKITNTDTPPAQEEIVDDNNQIEDETGDTTEDDENDGSNEIIDSPALTFIIGG